MRAREESIYLASGMGSSASGHGENHAAGQVADRRMETAGLLARQEEEQSLFRDLLASALDLSMPGGNAPPSIQPPEQLNARIAGYIAFALEGGPLQRPSSRSGFMGRGSGAPEERYWATGADADGAAVSMEEEPLWIHCRAREDSPEGGSSLSARHDRKQGEFRPGRKKDKETGAMVPDALKRRRFLALCFRLFTVGAFFAAGYLLLVGRACSPAGM
jgi:hypothetical protein